MFTCIEGRAFRNFVKDFMTVWQIICFVCIHDIEPLPNGNILCIVSDTYSNDQIVSKRRNPSLTPGEFDLEKIIEIKPLGSADAEIVWEWKFADHLVQDFDPSLENFGIVSDHPELLDLNYDNGRPVDFIHLNSVDYNPQLDQVVISARHLSEFYVIDHSTSTEEAAGREGGKSGRGGDFLFRWCNNQVFRKGANSQKLFSEKGTRSNFILL